MVSAKAGFLCLFMTSLLGQAPLPRIATFGIADVPLRLYWGVENAETVSITSIGTVAPSGSTPISPRRTTVYTLTARAAGGVARAKVLVTIPSGIQFFTGVSPRLLNFFDHEVGAAARLVFSISPGTPTDINLRLTPGSGTPPGVFAVVGPTAFRAQSTRAVEVQFKPPAPGAFRATVDVQTQDFNATVELRGGGAANGAARVTALYNAASHGADVASNTWVSLIGELMTTTTRAWTRADFEGDRLPTDLAGTSVLIGGSAGFVSYVSPTQINVLLPPGLSQGFVEAVVRSPAGPSNPFPIEIKARAPAPFLLTSGSRYVAAVLGDGTLIAPTGFLGEAVTTKPAGDDDIVALYLTGAGETSPSYPVGALILEPLNVSGELTVWVSDHIVDVLYAVLVGPGLYQVGMRVPAGIPAGDQFVDIEVGGQSAEGTNVIAIDRKAGAP